MAAHSDNVGKMRGGVRRRGPTGTWSYVIDMGKQSAQRCEHCGWRGWVTRERIDRCPKCGRTPIDTRERRLVEVAGFRTRQDAVQARAEKVRTLGEGTFVVPTKVSLAEYLRDTWLPAIGGEGLKPTTMVCYRELAMHHIVGPEKAPYLVGATPLQRVTREAIKAHYAFLSASGRVTATVAFQHKP